MKLAGISFQTVLVLLSMQVANPGYSHVAQANHGQTGRSNSHDSLVTAQFGSGESNWKSWTTIIDRRGAVVQTVYGEKPRRFTVPKGSLQTLLTLANKERFDRLRPDYPADAVDGPTLILTIQNHGRLRSVAVHPSTSRPESPEIRRFLKVWSALLKVAPSPNADQTPAVYLK